MAEQASPYLNAFEGGFIGLLRWPQWDELCGTLKAQADAGWYVYAVGEEPPEQAVDASRLNRFLDELDQLIRHDHGEDYCGIAYADNLQTPTFIKIYDPNNLGASCGSSGQKVLPGWTLSLQKPVNLADAFPPPAGRRRWWQRIFAN